jgi:putative tryptophan/tyrosine transport system substrate-binding protein
MIEGHNSPISKRRRAPASIISRRNAIALFGVAAAIWPLAITAQQARIPRIGIIDDGPLWDHFRQGLREHGLIEGRSVALEYRTAGSEPNRLAAAASELSRLPVDLIATYGTSATQAAKSATSTIPIVMIGIGDPVRAGLVSNLARPGGNVSGNTVLGPDIVAKRLQLLREVFPGAARVAFLWNPDNASQVPTLEEARAAAPLLGVTIIPVGVRNVEEFEIGFATITRERPDALIMGADPFQQIHFDRILGYLAERRLPALFLNRDQAVAGGLMSYGASLSDLMRRAGGYAHRILQGTKPADLPIEQPAKFELVVNLKTAKAMGLAIPESFLLRADEVIE